MSTTDESSKTPACDLVALLDARDAALVTLVAGEMQLAVHRSVLVAKSPVFSAMLAHDMSEANSGRIVITDVDPEVLQQLLLFTYQDSTPQLCSMAPQLLMAADKYCLPDLKAQCELQLIRDLSVENVTSSASIALRHSCCRLKEVCGIYMQANFTKVMGTEGWAEAVRKHPEEFVEVTRLVAAKPSKPRNESRELDQRLLEAVKKNNLKEMQQLLATGADVGARDTSGKTALHLSANSPSRLRFLLQTGADVALRDGSGRTALHFAATSGDKEAVACLLQAGARVDVMDTQLQTALHSVIQGSNLEVLQQLLAVSSDVNTADTYGCTPLHLAAERGNEAVIQALLDVGADKYARNKRRETPLHVAERCHKEELRALLSVSGATSASETNENPKVLAYDFGAVLDARDAALVTLVARDIQLAVHRSVLVARSPVFASMLAHNTEKASSGCILVEDVKPEVLQQLLQFMYKDSIPQHCSVTPQLLVAADRYCVSDLKAQCEIQLARDLSVENVMMSASVASRHSCPHLTEAAGCFLRTNFTKVVATEGWKEAVHNHPEKFVEFSCLIATTPAKTRSASQEEMDCKLLKVAETVDSTEVQELLNAGADVGTRDVRGRTALHIAAAIPMYCLTFLGYLLKAGADLGAKDESGRTALHCAAARGLKNTTEYLLQYGACVDVRDRWLQTPLHAAAQGNSEIVGILAKASSDVNAADVYGCTPLHLAAQWFDISAVRALLNAGADKNIRNNEREAPRDVADRYKREHLLALLK
ncbi:serine/threonine-protein phosphatase 6 regulatory ankyrin repeat subunit A-like isoform X2 [Schistocerca serialis cubense]|nr:serine/threonine-protein phosphatase 6 regulatory ankyrin repeat subunit A-like isoform X2 [Schistocerca serialis cubense]XP_049943833.1 serine/threonine-protein phosphatase 6 regulatory ankyrin repeat subunit A-like isoform X2 [Schistocerca serialis cubense]XP_049943834.1 serine/threonine-protein phosphatase 6 regulatory ankyrin repeat subunit A-like isoform X2 [Schistocerca serialis cubense]XP_049943835.1 serine/threonine-protein phosphatase 6 regulatory ankyrin repeat subunit A-like isofor